MVSRVAFGSMRLVNVSKEDDSAILIRKAYDSGINFFDTTRRIQDSEKILGDAIYDIKKNVILATTTTAFTGNDIRNELESSLMSLHCDSIDSNSFRISFPVKAVVVVANEKSITFELNTTYKLPAYTCYKYDKMMAISSLSEAMRTGRVIIQS